MLTKMGESDELFIMNHLIPSHHQVCSASPCSNGAVFSSSMNDGSECPAVFALRSLTSTTQVWTDWPSSLSSSMGNEVGATCGDQEEIDSLKTWPKAVQDGECTLMNFMFLTAVKSTTKLLWGLSSLEIAYHNKLDHKSALHHPAMNGLVERFVLKKSKTIHQYEMENFFHWILELISCNSKLPVHSSTLHVWIS